MEYTKKHRDIGILILRVGIGAAFMLIHGWPKITGGPDLWMKLGGAMSNLGINFAPEFWGIISSVTEFGGGILILIGLFTRVTACFLTFNMIVATLQLLAMHLPWNLVINPIEILSVFAALIFFGGGRYSLDYLIFSRKQIKVKIIEKSQINTANRQNLKTTARPSSIVTDRPAVKTENKSSVKLTI